MTSPPRHRDVTTMSPRGRPDAATTPPRSNRDVTAPPPRHHEATTTTPRRHQDATTTPPRCHHDVDTPCAAMSSRCHHDVVTAPSLQRHHDVTRTSHTTAAPQRRHQDVPKTRATFASERTLSETTSMNLRQTWRRAPIEKHLPTCNTRSQMQAPSELRRIHVLGRHQNLFTLQICQHR
jgi:hypothetical protein